LLNFLIDCIHLMLVNGVSEPFIEDF
jgi:hypothetical protein